MASATRHSPVVLRSTGPSMAQPLLGGRSRSARPRRASKEALRVLGASLSSLLASAPPCKNPKERTLIGPAEAPLTERHHPGMVGEIISECRATSNRNGGRHHRGFAGDFPRNPQRSRKSRRLRDSISSQEGLISILSRATAALRCATLNQANGPHDKAL